MVLCSLVRSLLLRHSSVLVGNRTAVAAAGGATCAMKNLMMELRKTCNHPFLVDAATPHSQPGERGQMTYGDAHRIMYRIGLSRNDALVAYQR